MSAIDFEVDLPSAEDASNALDTLLAKTLTVKEVSCTSGSQPPPTLNEVQVQTEALRRVSEALQTVAKLRLAALYKQHNNLVSFHNKLPIELQSQIVLESLERKGRTTWAQSNRRLAELSTVSTSWWTLINESPELWTVIDLEQPGQVSWALDRSKHITFDVAYHSTSAIGDIPPAHDPLNDNLALLQPHIHRCRAINMSLLDSHQFRACSWFLALHLPKLEHLQVGIKLGAEDLPINAPNVHHLRFWGVSPAWTTSDVTKLKALSLGNINLTKATLINILSRSPQLEELIFDKMTLLRDTSPTNTSSLPINLSQLTTFESRESKGALQAALEDILQTGSRLEYLRLHETRDPNNGHPLDCVKVSHTDGRPTLLGTLLQNIGLSHLFVRFDFDANRSVDVKGFGASSRTDEEVGFRIKTSSLDWIGIVTAIETLVNWTASRPAVHISVSGTLSIPALTQLPQLDNLTSLEIGPDPELSMEALRALAHQPYGNLVEVLVVYPKHYQLPRGLKTILDPVEVGRDGPVPRFFPNLPAELPSRPPRIAGHVISTPPRTR